MLMKKLVGTTMNITERVITCEELGVTTKHYINIECEGFHLIVDSQLGFFNASWYCQLSGKQLKHFQEKSQTQNLIEVLSIKYGTTIHHAAIPNRYECAGTYYHPILFLAFVMWCESSNHELYVKASLIVLEYFNNAERRKLLNTLLNSIKTINLNSYIVQSLNCNSETDDSDQDQDQQVPLSEEHEQPPANTVTVYNTRNQYSIILYACLKVIVNQKGWCNATKFCASNNKQLRDFERLPNFKEVVRCLDKVLKRRPVMYLDDNFYARGKYYHPIMFLKLASWVNVDYYEMVATFIMEHYPTTSSSKIIDDNNEITNDHIIFNSPMCNNEKERTVAIVPDKKDTMVSHKIQEMDVKWKIMENEILKLKLENQTRSKSLENALTLLKLDNEIKDIEIVNLKLSLQESVLRSSRLEFE
jgi:hypothetical protein